MITSKTANVLDVRLANGNKCKMKDTKLLGYCHCQLHEGYLTAAILCEHDCIKKQCHHLEKYASHPYWAYLEWKKKEKAKHRTTMKEIRSKLINTDIEMEKLVVAAQRLADGMDYPIIITRIAHKATSDKDYEFVINYVSDDLFDDWHLYFDLAISLAKCYGGKYTLRHLKLPNGKYASINDWNNRRKN